MRKKESRSARGKKAEVRIERAEAVRGKKAEVRIERAEAVGGKKAEVRIERTEAVRGKKAEVRIERTEAVGGKIVETGRYSMRFRIGAAIVLAGLLILLFPLGQQIFTEYMQKKALAEAAAVIGQMQGMQDVSVDSQEDHSGVSGNGVTEDACDASLGGLFPGGELSEEARALYEACTAYNEELFANGQKDMVDLESVEDFPLRTADYGFPEEVIGILTVPRLEVELPLYLGASKEHMALGAALFGQTSVPMGIASLGQTSGNSGESEHVLSAICAHRGYRGTPMFREIEEMQVGDPIYITTPWEDLEYRVTETRVVLPSDTSWCRIEDGMNQIVLMTCHPYTKHTHRYLVFAEIVLGEKY